MSKEVSAESLTTLEMVEAAKIEPKRIQRLRALAKKGAHGSATIEKIKINGFVAQATIAFYDATDAENKLRVETFSMLSVLSHTMKLIEKGRFTFKTE